MTRRAMWSIQPWLFVLVTDPAHKVRGYGWSCHDFRYGVTVRSRMGAGSGARRYQGEALSMHDGARP